MISRKLIGAAILATALAVVGSRADDAVPAPAAAAAPAGKPGVTIVNLHLEKAMPQDAFDELAKQSGVKFSTNGNLWEQDSMQNEFDVDLTNRPFWSAVNEVCGLWNISPQPNYGNNSGRRIMLGQAFFGPGGPAAAGQRPKPPTFESDGFLVQAVSFNRQQSVNYTMPEQSQNNCSVQLMVFVDPSLHLLSFSQSAKPTEAVDDAGNSMLPDQKNNVFYGNGMQQSMIFNCTVPLKYPDNPGKKIAHLKFNLQMRGSESVDTMTVDKPLEAAETTKQFGDTTITFRSLKKSAQNGNGYELKLGISDDNDQQGGGNMWNLLQTAQLEDAKGRAFSYGGGGGGGGNGGMVEYTVNYSDNGGMGNDQAGDPVKWVIQLPTKTHSIKVPVEFKDLKLP